MTMIAAFVAATIATPSCSGRVGEPVAISSAPLAIEALGGTYRTDTGWSAPGEGRVGQLRYDWGLMLQSDDPRFANFDLSAGAIHSGSSGCWFQSDSAYTDGRVASIRNARMGESGYRQGYVPPRPDVTPTISRYQFVAADGVHRDGFTWIGVWNAEGPVERSQIVAFNQERHLVLATLPVRLGAISQLPDLHSQAYHLTFVGEGKPGRSAPWMRLIWR